MDSLILYCDCCRFVLVLGLVMIPLTDSTYNGEAVCMTRPGQFEVYNTAQQFCCNNKLYRQNGNMGCCNTEVIDMDTHLCCANTKHKRWLDPADGDQAEEKCCGSQVLRTNESRCCHQHVISPTKQQRKDPQHFSCCSSTELVDLRSEYCCSGRRFNKSDETDCCAGKQYHTDFQKCVTVLNVERIILKHEKMCGTEPYNVLENSCCGGVINRTVAELSPDNIAHFACCGTTVIDPTTQICCPPYNVFPFHAIPKHDDFKCCGHGYYNTTCQECVANEVVPKPPGHIRCGQRLIDTQQEGCCGYNKPYNLTDQQCCNGSLSSVIKKTQTCCNGAGVKEDELCCEGYKPCTKDHPEDDACCMDLWTYEGRTYNSATQYCMYGGVVQPLARELEYCGRKPFDPSKQFCCDNWTLTDIASGLDSCCGQVSYDSNSHTCCYGIVFDVPSNNAQCCGKDFVATRPGDPTSLCTAWCSANKSVSYNSETQTCCEDKVYTTKPGRSCCGSFYIDTKVKGCCAHQIVYRMRRSTIGCCNSTDLYDKKTSTCQLDRVVPLISNQTDTEAVCERMMVRSVDGLVKHACSDLYAVVGKLKAVRVLRGAGSNETKVKVDLGKVRPLQLGLARKKWKFFRRMTFKIHLPTSGDKVICRSGLKRKSFKVAVFFSARVRGRVVTISSQESFRLVKQRLLRKLRFNDDFCKNLPETDP